MKPAQSCSLFFPVHAARPMTRMTLTTPTIVARAQKRKMTVATCMSANGKPPSVIKWDTRLKGEANYQETRNQNGTVTVRSNYVVVPSRETHKQKLTCIVTYRNERITDSVVLNVQCKDPIVIDVPLPHLSVMFSRPLVLPFPAWGERGGV